jgi:hypothetical protein
VSAHSALGLAGFVISFAAAGYGVLFAARGIPTVRSALADVGLAYLIGTAALGSVLTLWVILGLPFGLVTILALALLTALAGTLAGRRRRWREVARRPQSWPAYLLTAVFVALVVVLLEAVFRSGRLQGLFGWDAGSFWVPKAQALFATGGLDEAHFGALPGPGYPPLVPVLQASAFELMGSADVIALHTLYFTLIVGFVAAAARLLGPLASNVAIWGALLLVLAAHRVVADGLTPQADLILDLYVALAVAAIALWIGRSEWTAVAFATIFLVAAMLTKREGLLLVAAVGAGLVIAYGRRWRLSARLVAVVVGIPIVAAIPWRLWYTSRSLPGQGPESGPLDLLDTLDRLWPSARLSISTVTDPRLWSLVVVVMLLAAIAALLVGERVLPVFALSFTAATLLGFTWVMWSFPSLPLTTNGALNPIPRLAGGLVLPAAMLAAVLLQQVIDGLRLRLPDAPSARFRALTMAVVVYVAIAYPAGVLAFRGLPRFPDVDECAATVRGEPFLLVYTHRDSLREARVTADDLASKGFVGVEVEPDGCGRWEVANPDVNTLEQARGHIEDARRVGFEPRLERP